MSSTEFIAGEPTTASSSAVSSSAADESMRHRTHTHTHTHTHAHTHTHTHGDAPLADHVVIYDGVCNLCHGTVKFLITRDPGKIFKFCALQSAAARAYLDTHALSREEALKSIVFIDGGVVYRKSDAALRIASYLPAPWRWLSVATWVPSLLRDAVYDCVAGNRYRVFGVADECLMPTKDIMSRFLDLEEMKRQGRKKKE